MTFPLPFVCQHAAYTAGVPDDWGNVTPGHLPPVDVPCMWWTPSSSEPPLGAVNGERVIVDLVLVVDSSLVVDSRDRFTIEGRDFSVVGVPEDFDHGPFGFAPGRRPINLKAVSG